LFSVILVDVTLEGAHLDAAVDQIVTLAQDMGGTMEYVHGIGVKLAHLMPRELGTGMDMLRSIKVALDPHNIMNPGNLGL